MAPSLPNGILEVLAQNYSETLLKSSTLIAIYTTIDSGFESSAGVL